MKNLLFCWILFAGIGLTEVSAQAEFRFGFQAGLPVGHIENSSNLKAGMEAAYLFSFVDILEVGPMLGYSHYFIKERIDLPYYKSSETQDIQLIPLTISGRAYFGGNFYLGAAGGYAFSLENWTNGGIYYRPKMGVIINGLGINASYEGINMDEGTISSVNIGVEFNL